MERSVFFIKEVFCRMKCWHCNTEIIWGGDHDFEDKQLPIFDDFDCEGHCGL